MWDASSQKKVLDVDVGDWVECLDWSGDGKTLGCGGGFDKQGKLFDAEDGELQETLDHGGIVYACAFAPTQPVFACGCFEKKVTLWHKDRGHLLRTLSCDGVLKALAWRPDGSMLASGGFDAAVTVWRADASSTKQPEEIVWRSKLDSIAADCRDLAYTPDGSILASCDWADKVDRLRRGDREKIVGNNEPGGAALLRAGVCSGGRRFCGGRLGLPRDDVPSGR